MTRNNVSPPSAAGGSGCAATEGGIPPFARFAGNYKSCAPGAGVAAQALPPEGGRQDGHYFFIADEDFNGEASFEYHIRDEAGNVSQAKVRIDVQGVNDFPLAKEAIYVTMKEDAARSFTLDQLLKPILDKEGDVLSIGKIMNVTGGRVELVTPSGPSGATSPACGGGQYIFIADKDYNGIGGFAYEVSDGKGGVIIHHVTINIDAVNDAPITQDHQASMFEDGTLTFTAGDLLQGSSDIDGDVSSVAWMESVKSCVLRTPHVNNY